MTIPTAMRLVGQYYIPGALLFMSVIATRAAISNSNSADQRCDLVNLFGHKLCIAARFDVEAEQWFGVRPA